MAFLKAEARSLTANGFFAAFVALSVLFVVLMNLFAGRQVGWGGFTLSNAGILLIAPVMVLQNVIAEIWGKRTAFRVTVFAVFCQLLVVALSQIVILMPIPNDAGAQAMSSDWASVFGSQWRIASASITAFTIGSILNILIFAKIRGKTKSANGKYKFFYIIASVLSTAAAQFVDSTIFMILAFAPVGISPFEWNWTAIWQAIAVGTLVQLALETVLVAAATVHVAKWLKGKKEAEENMFCEALTAR